MLLGEARVGMRMHSRHSDRRGSSGRIGIPAAATRDYHIICNQSLKDALALAACEVWCGVEVVGGGMNDDVMMMMMMGEG